jgi:hypothetical protein
MIKILQSLEFAAEYVSTLIRNAHNAGDPREAVVYLAISKGNC